MQHDLQILVLAAALVALVSYTPWLRVPIGLLLALVGFAMSIDVAWLAVAGAAGMTGACLAIAMASRSGRDRFARAGSLAQQRRQKLRDQLSRSPEFGRLTLLAGLTPFVPPRYLFSILGSMRAPLLPALAGVFFGRLPLLIITTLIFTGIGELATDTDHQAALLLGVLGILIVVMRTVNAIDWQHRAETGHWRMTDEAAGGGFGQATFSGLHLPDFPEHTDRPEDSNSPDPSAPDDAGEIIEAEVLEEEILPEDHDDDSDR